MFEVNEAFAPVLLAWSGGDRRRPGRGPTRTAAPSRWVTRSAPPARILATSSLHELERTGGRYGLQTMCEGGGQANATVIERVS